MHSAGTSSSAGKTVSWVCVAPTDTGPESTPVSARLSCPPVLQVTRNPFYPKGHEGASP